MNKAFKIYHNEVVFENIVFGVFVLVSLYLVAPFLIISAYNNPSADDFCFASITNNAGFFTAQKHWYMTWTGRYFSTAVNSVNPLYLNMPLLYKIFPIFFILGHITAFYYLLRSFLRGVSWKLLTVLSLLVFLFFLLKITSPVQAFYWLAGAATYELTNILFLIMMIVFVEILKDDNPSKKRWLIFTLLACAVAGNNETIITIVNFLFGVIFLSEWCLKKTFFNKSFFAMIIFLFFSLIVVSAPGNFVRSSHSTEAFMFFNAIEKSNVYFASRLHDWMFQSPFFVLFILGVLTLGRAIKGKVDTTLYTYKWMVLVPLILTFLCPYLGFFTSFFATNMEPPSRADNVMFFFFLLGSLLTCIQFSLLLDKYIQVKISLFNTVLVGVISFFLSIEHAINYDNVFLDLKSESAKNYDLEFIKRDWVLKNGKCTNCVVNRNYYHPSTIFFSDINKESEEWVYKCSASFYNVENINTFE